MPLTHGLSSLSCDGLGHLAHMMHDTLLHKVWTRGFLVTYVITDVSEILSFLASEKKKEVLFSFELSIYILELVCSV